MAIQIAVAMSVICRPLTRYHQTGSLRRHQGQGRRRLTTLQNDLTVILVAFRDPNKLTVSVQK